MININLSDDPFYRYKMEKVNITNKGCGNGLLTVINNLDNISKSINTPPEILSKYIATSVGSNYNEKKKTINGCHTQDKIQEAIYNYINDFVICNNCNIPELNFTLSSNILESKCSACGSINKIKNNNKINQKIVDLILKYLNKNKIWTVSNGNMVSQNTFNSTFNIEEYGKLVDELNDIKLVDELNDIKLNDTELNDIELNDTELNTFNPF